MIKKSCFFAISLRYDKKTGFFLQFNFIYLFQNGFTLNSTSTTVTASTSQTHPPLLNWLGHARCVGVCGHGVLDVGFQTACCLWRHCPVRHPNAWSARCVFWRHRLPALSLSPRRRLSRLRAVLDEFIGESGDVHQTVLMDADVHERAEVGDVGNHAFEYHADLQVADFVDAFGE